MLASDYVEYWWPSAVDDALVEWDLGLKLEAFRRALNAKVMHVGQGRLRPSVLDFGLAATAIEAVWASFQTELINTEWGASFRA